MKKVWLFSLIHSLWVYVPCVRISSLVLYLVITYCSWDVIFAEQSAAVRQAVGDPRMKEALRRIDGAKDRRKVLEEIMMDAEFASFADLLLTVIQYEEE